MGKQLIAMLWPRSNAVLPLLNLFFIGQDNLRRFSQEKISMPVSTQFKHGLPVSREDTELHNHCHSTEGQTLICLPADLSKPRWEETKRNNELKGVSPRMGGCGCSCPQELVAHMLILGVWTWPSSPPLGSFYSLLGLHSLSTSSVYLVQRKTPLKCQGGFQDNCFIILN